MRIAECGWRINRPIESAIRNPQSAMSRRIDRPCRSPRITPRDALHRLPSAADDAVAGDHRFGVAAAGRAEAAAQADARGDRRAGALIKMNRGDGDRLRVEDGRR
jgi:hypothetical protein